MASLRDFVKTVSTVLPEVPKPMRKPNLTEKLIWTALALVVYLVMSITPLYAFGNRQDNFAYLRVIFASTQGTLMELGIGPIVTAGLILQLLQGSDIIKLDFGNPEDRAIFGSATKLLTFIVIAVEAGAYIVGGALGTLGSTQAIVIFFQLFGASVIVLLLDELIQKGWGLGSGISLFILAGVAQTVMWYTFSPTSVATSNAVGSPTIIFGFIPAVISGIFSGGSGIGGDSRVPVPEPPNVRPDSRHNTLHNLHRGDTRRGPDHVCEVQGLCRRLSDKAALRVEHTCHLGIGTRRRTSLCSHTFWRATSTRWGAALG